MAAIEEAKRLGLITEQQANEATRALLGGELRFAATAMKNIDEPWGIDVSHFSGNVNWKKVAARSEIRFAFIKASDGRTFKDPKFHANWTGAANAGLVRGAYHFWRPDVPGKTQAELLIGQMGFLARGDLPPVIDVEEGDAATWKGVSPADAESNIQECVDRVYEEFGKYPIIYTGRAFWDDPNFLDGSTAFRNLPLWISAYSPQDDPKLPGGWPTWEFWQFADRLTKFDGVPGECDLNAFNGDVSSLLLMAGLDPLILEPGSTEA
jgi:lysozyme